MKYWLDAYRKMRSVRVDVNVCSEKTSILRGHVQTIKEVEHGTGYRKHRWSVTLCAILTATLCFEEELSHTLHIFSSRQALGL